MSWACAFAGALLLNLLVLFWLSREQGWDVWSGARPQGPSLALSLLRPAVEPERLAPDAHPPATASPSRVAVRPSMPSSGAVAPAASAVPAPAPSTAGTGPTAAPGEGEAQAKTRAALQRLGGCADFSRREPGESACGRGWGDQGQTVETLSAAQRAEFAVDTPDDKVARAAKVRDALINHDSHGNHINYGCTWSGGKMTCSAY